ncbi:MAG: response regulator transcription factor [Gemmatimonadetes bacterium]|nr:response regulator transcription factor [Gemmatimonadota bacterium]
MTPIRIMVVDDHSVVRESIRHVLGDATAFTFVGEAASATEAIASVAAAAPDVIILDISMPGGSGLPAVAELLERSPGTRVLMLSVHDDAEYVIESVRAGAHGYLRKDSSPAEMRAAIAAVHAGSGYYSPKLAGVLADALRGRAAAPEPEPAPAPRAAELLTARELEILAHIADGATNREIGTRLGISTRTVEAHRDSLMRKLGVRTVAGLTRLAIEQGIRPPER